MVIFLRFKICTHIAKSSRFAEHLLSGHHYDAQFRRISHPLYVSQGYLKGTPLNFLICILWQLILVLIFAWMSRASGDQWDTPVISLRVACFEFLSAALYRFSLHPVGWTAHFAQALYYCLALSVGKVFETVRAFFSRIVIRTFSFVFEIKITIGRYLQCDARFFFWFLWFKAHVFLERPVW